MANQCKEHKVEKYIH